MSDEAVSVDVDAVVAAAAGLHRTFASAGWTRPATPDVYHSDATQAIGTAASAVFGVAGSAADQMTSAERALTIAAIEVRAADELGAEWVAWPF